ncbi:GntR family transcriptional regulator [Streptococcus didelphis]|uniref:GntR family transcriptional regulator n=1 Tax=Streptococcus didelphis TaxID=102886 RepID=UPI0003808465|nr:GntR family transcriptional regulator [Streptococcus didelphis]
MTKNDLSRKLKKLKHVQVYNEIFRLIQDGIYKPGMQLPSEPELAEQLKVSRMTLRKSLALLQEDHLVKNIRGKGNFIQKYPENPLNQGLEILQHPIKACLTTSIQEVETEFRIEVPTVAITSSLKRESPVVVIADRWYHTAEQTIAYTLSLIPIEVISEFNVNLNQEESLRDFLETSIYQKENADYALNQISYTKTGNFTATKYILSKTNNFILIQENIYKGQQMLINNKHYIPIEYFDLKIKSKTIGKNYP